MQQGLKTVQGKSEMLPLYQDKKEHVFRSAQNTKNQNKKHPFRVLFISPNPYFFFLPIFVFLPLYRIQQHAPTRIYSLWLQNDREHVLFGF